MIKAAGVTALLIGCFIGATWSADKTVEPHFGDVNLDRVLVTAPPITTTSIALNIVPKIVPTTTTTTEAPVPVSAFGALEKCDKEINAKLKQFGLPINPFSYIARRESNCNPNAINAIWNDKGELVWSLNKNGSWDSGLLQINSVHIEGVKRICGKAALANHIEGLRNIDCNLAVAAALYDNGKGLFHWQINN